MDLHHELEKRFAESDWAIILLGSRKILAKLRVDPLSYLCVFLTMEISENLGWYRRKLFSQSAAKWGFISITTYIRHLIPKLFCDVDISIQGTRGISGFKIHGLPGRSPRQNAKVVEKWGGFWLSVLTWLIEYAGSPIHSRRLLHIGCREYGPKPEYFSHVMKMFSQGIDIHGVVTWE